MANTFDPTNGNYTISSLDDFKAFRDAVNGGNSFAGKTITLAADIDLNNEEWTPIGTSEKAFKGTFDGGNHTISNLKITGYNSNVGLFGFTTDGEIKNFTLTNADVSGRLNVGAVCGQPYTSKYTNITLTGNVQVKGMAYVGGMLGKNAYANLTDLTIDANDGSLVSAVSEENGKAYRTYVGGVVGFMGEGGHTLKNITSNINVEGTTCDVGGIIGIAHYGNKLENVTCTAEKIVLTNADPTGEQEIGGIAGVWHNESGTTVTMTNCSVSDTLQLEVQVNGVKDDALTAAVQDNTLTGAPYSANGTGTLAIPLNSDYITTDVVVKGNQTLTADNANLASVFELTGLKAGEAREVKLYFFEAGSTEGGIEVAVQVGEGVTSMPVYLTQFANGLYDVQVVDVSNVSRPVTEIDGVQLTNGTITVEKGGLDIDNLNIGANSFVTISGNSSIKVKKHTGKPVEFTGGTLTDSYLGSEGSNLSSWLHVSGEATFAGSYKGQWVWVSGDNAKLTIAEGADVDIWGSAGWFGLVVGGMDNDLNNPNYQRPTYTAGGEVVINSNADVNAAYVLVGGDGLLTVNGSLGGLAQFEVQTGGIAGAEAGKVLINAGGSISDVVYGTIAGTMDVKGLFDTSLADGYGSLLISGTMNVIEGGKLDFGKNALNVTGTLLVDGSSLITGTNLNFAEGSLIIDAAGFTGTDKVLNLNASSMDGKVTIINKDDDVKVFYRADGDIILSDATMDKIYVSADWAGKEFGDNLGAGMAFGINSFETLAEAKAVLGTVGGTIELVTEAGSDKVVSGSVSFANGINTITGEAAIDWSKGWFFIGRGTGAENGATVIFDGATITSASDSSSYGFHVSGEENGSSSKKDGILKVMNGSDVEVDYLINRGEIVVDNSELTVKNGFGIAGRPANETPTGEKATATITLQNNATVIVDNENGMGIGTASTVQEGYGVLNVTESTLKYNAGVMNVSGNGTVNLNDGATLDIAGGVANNGTINVLGDDVTVNAINNAGTVNLDDATFDGTINNAGKDYTGTLNITGETTINGTVNNIVQGSGTGFSTNPADGESFYAPYQKGVTAGKILMGSADKAADVTLNGTINTAKGWLRKGTLNVTDGAGLYGTPEDQPSWMNVNVNGSYQFNVGDLFAAAEDVLDVTFDGTTPIAEMTLEKGAEMARFGHISVGSDDHDKGDNAYVINVEEGAAIKDFAQITTRGDGTLNVAGSVVSYTTKSYQSSSAAASYMFENAKDGALINNNGIINVSDTGLIYVDTMNIGRKPQYGEAELNIDGGKVQFTNSINVGYDGSKRPGKITLTNGGKLISEATSYELQYNNGREAGIKTIDKAAGTLNIGHTTAGSLEAIDSEVSVGQVTVGAEGVITLEDATLTAAEVKNSGKVIIAGDSTVNTVISGGEILFGTADKAVDTTIDSDKVRGKVAIENGEVTFTGTNTNAIHPILVGATLNNATWKHEIAADAASAKLIVDEDATLKACQILVGNNDSVNQHSLQIDGAVVMSSSLYAKASSNVTVNGTLLTKYFMAAGITTVNGSVEIIGESSGNALYISTDATAWDSIFTIENGGSVTITSGKNVLVGKEAGHTGKLVLDGTAALISNGAVTVGEGSSLELDYNSKLTFTDLLSAGTVSIDMNGYDNGTYKVFDATGSAAIDYSSLLSGFDADLMKVVGNDLYITTQVNDVLYVNAAWADKAAGDIVDGGKIIGYNAFGKIGDVNSAIQSNTSRVEIAAGSYAASGYVDMEKDGTLDIEVTGTGAATLTSGNWCFGTNVYENAVVNVKGDFVAEKGMVWFLGDNKGTTINFSGSTTSAANTTFRGGNVTISEGSSITVDADASQWAQMMIYANVTCYGAISVDIVNPMGAAFLVGTNAYKNSMGYLYSVLTLSGENASLTANQPNSNGNSTVDIRVAGQGKMIVKDGATVTTDGYLQVKAQDANAKDANGNAYGGTLIIDGANLNAANVINEGLIAVQGESTLNIDKLTGNAIQLKGGSLTDSTVKGDVLISADEEFKGANVIDNTIVIGGTTTVDNGASLTGESVELTSGFEVTGLTAGAERDIRVSIVPAGESDGQYIWVHVEEGATSAFAMTSIIPDGTYDLTVIDGSNIYKRLNVEISGGEFAVNGGVLDVTTFTGSFDVTGKSTVQIDNYTSGTMSVAAGSTLVDTKVAGAGTVAFAADSVTYFEGENEITAAIGGATNFDLMVNEGASLLITRYVLGYDRDITVKGLLTDATAMENADGQILSLKANSTSGFSINGWGTSVLDVTDAYVDLANSSIKGDASTVGTYIWNFKNSYVKAASFGNCNDTTGTGSWTITLDDSKLVASNYIKNGVGVTTTFQNGSVATTGSMRIEGTLNIDATSSVVVTAYQNNKRGAQDEHGDFSGTLNLAGTLDITGSKLGVELYGATFNLTGGTLKLNNEDLILDAASKLNLTVGGNVTTAGSIVNGGTITVDATSRLTAAALTNNGTITIDAKNYTGDTVKVIDLSQNGKLTNVKLTNGANYYLVYGNDGDVTLTKVPETLYVSSDYNSSTDGYGHDKFNNYVSAYNFAVANNRKATIVVEKTNTVSGNCFDNNHKNYSNISVIVKDGAVVGNSLSKWDMTYAVTIEAGGVLQTARGRTSGHGNTHVKNTLTVGEAGSDKQAIVDFIHPSYKTASISIMYNGKLIANNALIEVGDLGFSGNATLNDSTIIVDGIVAFGKGGTYYTQTMTNSTMTVKGHNLMKENVYYSTQGTILNSLTMTNSTITVDDGVEDTVAENVTIKKLTMTNSSVTVEEGTAVSVQAALNMTNSDLNVGALTVTTAGKISMDLNSTIAFTSITNNGTISVATGAYTGGNYLILDYTGTGAMTADDYKAILGSSWDDGFFHVVDQDLYLTDQSNKVVYVNDAWKGLAFGDSTAEGYFVGYNAFDLDSAFKRFGSNATANKETDEFHFDGDVVTTGTTNKFYTDKDVAWTADQAVVIDTTSSGRLYLMDTTVATGTNPADADLSDIAEITIGKNITLKAKLINLGQAIDQGDTDAAGNVTRDGAAITLTAQDGAILNAGRFQVNTGSTLNIEKGAKVLMSAEYGEGTIVRAGGTINVTGNGKDDLQWVYGNNNYLSMKGGTLNLKDTYMQVGRLTLSADEKNLIQTSTGSTINLDNATLKAGDTSINAGSMIVMDGSTLNTSANSVTNSGLIVMDDSTLTAKSLTNTGKIAITGDSKVSDIANNGGTVYLYGFTGDLMNITGNGTVNINKDANENRIASTLTVTAGTTWDLGNNTLNIYGPVDGEKTNFVVEEGATVLSGQITPMNSANLTVNGTMISKRSIYNMHGSVGENGKLISENGHICVYGNTTVKGELTSIYKDSMGQSFLIGYTAAANAADNDIELLVDGGSLNIKRAANSYQGKISDMLINAGVDGKDAKLTLVNGATFNSDAKVVNKGKVSVTGSDFRAAALDNVNSFQALTGASIVVDGTFTNSGSLTITGASVTAADVVNTGTITIDTNSLLTANTLETTGTITIDCSDYTGGTVKVIDLNGTTSLSGKIVLQNAQGGGIVRLTDGDVIITDQDIDHLYVDADWADLAYGTVLADGKVIGYNAFGDTKSAFGMAYHETTIHVAGNVASGWDDAAYLKINATDGSVYTITGGGDDYQKLNPIFMQDADANAELIISDAKFTIGKLIAGSSANANTNTSSITVKDSYLKAADYTGGAAWWTMWGATTTTIENSVIGLKDSSALDITQISKGAAGANIAYVPYGNNHSMLNFGSAGTVTIKDSTLLTGFFQVADRGITTLDNALIYLGGSLNVGYTGSGTASWGGISADTYNVGGVATLTIGNGSYIQNIGWGDGGGNPPANNIGMHVGGGKAGAVIVTGGSTLAIEMNNVNNNCDGITVYNNGSLTVEDGSKVISRELANAGTITVDGSTLDAIAFTNTGKVAITGNSAVSDIANNGGTVYLYGFTGDLMNITGNGNIQLGKDIAGVETATDLVINSAWNAGSNTVTVNSASTLTINAEMNAGKLVNYNSVAFNADTTLTEFSGSNASSFSVAEDATLTVTGSFWHNTSTWEQAVANYDIAGTMNVGYITNLSSNGTISGTLTSGHTVNFYGAASITGTVNASGSSVGWPTTDGWYEAGENAQDGMFLSGNGSYNATGAVNVYEEATISLKDNASFSAGSVNFIDPVTAGAAAGSMIVEGAHKLNIGNLTGNTTVLFDGATVKAGSAVNGGTTDVRFLGDNAIEAGADLNLTSSKVWVGSLWTSDDDPVIDSGMETTNLTVNGTLNADVLWIGAQYADGIANGMTSTVTVDGGSISIAKGGSTSGLVIRQSGILNITNGGTVTLAKEEQVIVQGALTISGAGSVFETVNSPFHIYKDGAVVTVKDGGKLILGSYNDVAIRVGNSSNATGKLVLDDGDLVLKDTLNIWSEFVMDYESSITFSDTITLQSTGSFLLDLEGYVGNGTNVLLIDDVNNSWTVDQYKALLGNVWNDKAFSVVNGDLYLSGTFAPAVYVNTAWDETTCPSDLVWGVNAFNTVANAVANGAETIEVLGGTLTGTNAFQGTESTINAGTTASGMILGGYRVAVGSKTWFESEGDMNLTIEGGTFSSNVIGGSALVSGSTEHVGDINLTINGGTFAKQVAGGMYHAVQNGRFDMTALTGDVNFVITGGTFNARVYGGNFSLRDDQYARMSSIQGDVNLTIDSSANMIKFAGDVVAGSRHEGVIDGNVNVTVTGLGSNLSLGGYLWGGSSADHYYNDGKVTESHVTGNRNLTFSDFTGDFNGKVMMFNTVTVEDGSAVNFTNSGLNLNAVADWTFEYGSSMSGVAVNDFAGDKLTFDLAGFEADADGVWEMFSGSVAGFEDAATVILGGETASWNSTSNSWKSASYELSTNDDEDKLIISKLA